MPRSFWRNCTALALVTGLAACAETAMQERLDAAEKDNQQLQAELASLRSQGSAPSSGDRPVNAKPGQCYARITTDPQFKTVTEQVVATPASEKVRVIPAKYETVTEQVVTQEASERLEVVPATYKTVTERVLVEPERKRLVTVPAQYKTETRQIKVRDAYTVWKPGGQVYAVGANALGGRILENRTTQAGDVMCLVEVPAEYRTVTEQVLVKPETVREEVTPAKYRTIERRVIDQPATTRRVTIPAKYGTVTKTVVAEQARTESIPVKATYRTVERRVETAPSQTVWTTVLCDVNATPDVVSKMQTALRSQGHYSGPIDGEIGPRTRSAIRSYQASQGVKSDILTMDSAKKLGLTI